MWNSPACVGVLACLLLVLAALWGGVLPTIPCASPAPLAADRRVDKRNDSILHTEVSLGLIIITHRYIFMVTFFPHICHLTCRLRLCYFSSTAEQLLPPLALPSGFSYRCGLLHGTVWTHILLLLFLLHHLTLISVFLCHASSFPFAVELSGCEGSCSFLGQNSIHSLNSYLGVFEIRWSSAPFWDCIEGNDMWLKGLIPLNNCRYLSSYLWCVFLHSQDEFWFWPVCFCLRKRNVQNMYINLCCTV